MRIPARTLGVLTLAMHVEGLSLAAVLRAVGEDGDSRVVRDELRRVIAAIEEGEYDELLRVARTLVAAGLSTRRALGVAAELQTPDTAAPARREAAATPARMRWTPVNREVAIARTILHWHQHGSWPTRWEIAKQDGASVHGDLVSGRYLTVLQRAQQRIGVQSVQKPPKPPSRSRRPF